MRRKLRALNQILQRKLEEQRLFGKAEVKGRVLNVLVERVKGDQVDTQQLLDTVRAAVDAALLGPIRKVNVYLWCRSQSGSEDPEWSGSFDYMPLQVNREATTPTAEFRQDYSGIRVLFFGLTAITVLLYFLKARNWLDLIPALLSLVVGTLFPWGKRLVKRRVDPIFRRLGMGIGFALWGLTLWLLFQDPLQHSFLISLFLIAGLLLVGLGL
jgi:hypothetical protein